MVDTDDVQGYQRKFDNQRDLLTTADINENDREAIRKFIAHIRASDTDVDSLGTVVGHLNRLRLSAERSHAPLTELQDIDDINAFKLHLQDVHGLSEGTIRNYMKALRKFTIWLGRDFGKDVGVGSPIERKHDPDEEITSDELNAMLEAANQFDTASRDKALIALLYDTGLRIGAVLSFQIQHVNFEDRRGTITINENAHVKGADGPKPVTWSRGYVANWLDDHPRPSDPKAALIHKTRHWDEDEEGALRQQYAGGRIKEIADAAGLDADRIHAHLFRATAISDWIRDELSDQTIKNRVDWSEDGREFKTYSRVDDEEFNELVFDHYGIGDAEERETTGPDIDECKQCYTSLRGDETFCPSCAAPISAEATEAAERVDDATREYLIDEDDAEKRRVAAEAAERAESDPDFAKVLAEEVQKLQ